MSTNGLGYCPCGAGKRYTCQRCGRSLCGWHYASQPFSDAEGGVELGTVCWPVCDAPWWQELAKQPKRGHAVEQEADK